MLYNCRLQCHAVKNTAILLSITDSCIAKTVQRSQKERQDFFFIERRPMHRIKLKSDGRGHRLVTGSWSDSHRNTASEPCCDFRGQNFPAFSHRGIPGFYFARSVWLGLSSEYFLKELSLHLKQSSRLKGTGLFDQKYSEDEMLPFILISFNILCCAGFHCLNTTAWNWCRNAGNP